MPTEEEFENVSKAVVTIQAYLFFDYFKKYPFGSNKKIESHFSLLPPFFRLTVLRELVLINLDNADIIYKYGLIAAKALGKENALYAKKERGDDKGKLIPVRICFKRKSEEALENTRKKLKKKESKKQKSISPAAYTFNEYIVLATSLDDSISANEILELYRYRWQAELYFKRLKSILDYGEMPKKSEKSIFAWLNGKLMIALLIESMMGKADFSPSGDLYKEYMERD